MAASRVLLLTNVPAPYRFPVFECLAKDPRIELKVVFEGSRDSQRGWGPPATSAFQWESLRAGDHETGMLSLQSMPRAYQRISSFRPDALLCGGFGMSSICAAAYKTLSQRRVGLVLFGEATAHSERRIGSHRTEIRRRIVARCDRFLAASQDAAEYFRSLGAPHESIRVSLLTTDITAFAEPSQNIARRAKDIRNRMTHSGRTVLYCGKLIEAKGVANLLRAFALIQVRVRDCGLVLVGTGPLEQECRELVKELHLKHVILAGSVPYDEMPAWYRSADVFVFPSFGDRFGLVVLEAVASGIPVVCSRFAGAARDLLRDGSSGFIIDPHDISALAERVAVLLEDESLSERMRRTAAMIVERCRPEIIAGEFANSLLQAARHCEYTH